MNYWIKSITTFLIPYVAIGFSASIGAILRYIVGTVCGRLFETGFPAGTFLINITASIFIGWFLTISQGRMFLSETVRLAVAVGFVGTYSTFSTFAYEASSLLGDGSGIKALVYMLGSLTGGILAVRLGMVLAGGTL
jgi:fluoride exporter